MKRRMKSPSPALVISVAALFVALGGTTYAATSLPANSVGTKQLKNNAVTAKKISKSTISGLKAAGAGSVLTFDALATASPNPTTLGTALGDTWGAECVLSSGHADLVIFLKTTDGSWTYDLGQEINSPSTGSFHTVVAPGTFKSLTNIGTEQGATAPSDYELQDQGVQLTPVAGYLALHASVIDTIAPSHSCHMSVDATPQAVAAHGAMRRPSGSASSLRLLFGRR